MAKRPLCAFFFLCLGPLGSLGCSPPGLEAAAAEPAARAATSDSDAVRLVYSDVYDNGCPTCTHSEDSVRAACSPSAPRRRAAARRKVQPGLV